MVPGPGLPCSGPSAQAEPQGWLGDQKSRSCNCSWGDWQQVIVSSGKGFAVGQFLPHRLYLVPAPRMGPRSHFLAERWCDIFPSVPGQQCLLQGQGHAAASASYCASETLQAVAQAWRVSPLLLSWCCQTLALQGLRLTALPAHPMGFLSPSVQSTEK